MYAIYLLLLASCTDGSPLDTNPSADADTDADSDTDTDSDTDVGTASFDIVLPMGGATVTVDEEVVPCDASNVCAVTEAGDGTFEVVVTHATYYFIPKEVVIEGGVPSTSEVTYATGGCASDASYAGTDWCDDWVMSEYQVTVQGEYCDEQDRCSDVETGHGDLDGDGVEESMMDMEWGIQFNAAGNLIYGFSSEQNVLGYGNVSDDLTTVTFYYDVGASELARKIFTRE